MANQTAPTPTHSALSERVLTVENRLDGITQDVHNLATSVTEGFKTVNEALTSKSVSGKSDRRFTITIFLSLVGVLVPFIGSVAVGLWFVVTLQIQSITSPISANVAFYQGQSSQLGTNLNQLTTEFVSFRTDTIANRTARVKKEQEIETQFHKEQQIRNIQFAEQQRAIAVLWNAASDLGMKLPHYPTAPFYFPDGGPPSASPGSGASGGE